MDFACVQADEFEAIKAAKPDAQRGTLIGLALSGGGIRSATFNLGILQGLARRGLLKHFDYLSTVSGGGYIGSWYMALLNRLGKKPEEAEALLRPEAEHPAVTWLRRYSNYLAPKTGLSGDTLAMVSTYLRNLLLNLTTIVAFLGLVLLLPRLLAWGIGPARDCPNLPWLAGLPLLVAVAATCHLLSRVPGEHRRAAGMQWRDRQPGVLILVVLPVVVSAYFMAAGVASPGFAAWGAGIADGLSIFGWSPPSTLVASLLIAQTYWPAWLLLGVGEVAVKRERPMHVVVITFFALVASLLAGALFFGLAYLAESARPAGSVTLPANEQATFGPPLVLVAYMLTVTLHIGLVRRRFSDMQREWWARLGGWLQAVFLTWLLLGAIALFGPTLVAWLGEWAAASGALAWLAGTLWGVLAGKGADTGKAGGGGVRERLLRVVPAAFVLGLLILLSLGLHKALAPAPPPDREAAAAVARFQGRLDLAEGASERYTVSGTAIDSARMDLEHPLSPSPSPASGGGVRGSAGEGRIDTLLDRINKQHTKDKDFAAWRAQAACDAAAVGVREVVVAGGVLLIVFVVFGWRIDVNLFSLHNFYRNRLTRCYLGASRACAQAAPAGQDCRRPNPFTGFDPHDDLAVSALGPRPYPLFNTALNLVAGEELAWQQRKAAAFCIAPRFSGYQFPPGMEDGDGAVTYGLTDTFLAGDFKGRGGVRLGTAMAISGAAVNPNMGFHSSPAVSFLLTVFNVRLGRWVGNPDQGAWHKDSPSFGVRYLFFELFGMTSTRRAWLNLSDGGHFENLGIYELVRRRLPYIVAVDAAEDAEFHFEDLANAIRKIRADFGIDIEIDVAALRPVGDDGRQRAHVAIGRIRYDQISPQRRPGVLIYLRPGLTGHEPADVLGYARQYPAFPFQSTGDQFFDEAQFESYRRLGLHVADTVFGEASERQPTEDGQFNAESYFTVLREAWRSRLVVSDGLTTALHERLDALFERLRRDPDLAFLSEEFFPEWPELMTRPAAALALPADETQRRAGFYLCREVAQFMERAYLDLDLEANHDHPDCRGWMNLFRHWSWSPMFRATYAITAATLGEPFQRFCKRRLDLNPGEMRITLMSVGQGKAGLNFVERNQVAALEPEEGGAAWQLARFEMTVRHPPNLPKDQQEELLGFHVGFALLAGNRLVYLRIQDHLRRMGLARRALGLLFEQIPGLEMARETLDALPAGLEAVEAECEALLRLYRSVGAMRGQTPATS